MSGGTRKVSGSDGDRGGDPPHRDDGPTLPYTKAFLVQFSAETDDELRQAAGRVEHLKTGVRSRFTSIDSLCAWIAAVLAGNQDARGKGSSLRRRERDLESPQPPDTDSQSP
jgi:hypothetical protein